jgi:predicted dehydrogenase
MAALDQIESVDGLLICDPDEQAARAQAEELNRGEYYAGDWQTMLDDDDLPILVVLANNRDAGLMTAEALERGKWVYADKPGAATVADMEQIVSAGEKSGAYYCPCYARRPFPETREIVRLVSGGAIGELWSFELLWATSQAHLRGTHNWLFDAEAAGGGIVYWLLCHWLDLLRLATEQRVTSVSAMTATMDAEVSVEDVACACLQLETGAIGTMRGGYLLDPFPGYDCADLMMSFEGSGGSLAYVPNGLSEWRIRLRSRAAGFEWAAEGAPVEVERPEKSGYAPELLRDFLQAHADGTTPPATQHDALYVLKVAEAVYESARTGARCDIAW